MFVLNDQWTPEVFAQLKPLLAKARDAAQQKLIKRRVERQWNWLRALELVGRANYDYNQWFYFDGSEKSRDQAKSAVAEALQFLRDPQIADMDVVADSRLASRIVSSYQDPLEDGRPFRPGKASGLPGYSDRDTFGDLWKSHDLVADLPKQWKFHEDDQGVGIRGRWYAPDIDDSAWKTIQIGNFWSNQGYPTTSIGWYRLSTVIPKGFEGRKLILFFGAVDLWAHIWVNGQDVADRFAYKLQRDERFSVDITPYVKPGQDNLVVVRVQDYDRQGGIWKSIKLVSPKQ